MCFKKPLEMAMYRVGLREINPLKSPISFVKLDHSFLLDVKAAVMSVKCNALLITPIRVSGTVSTGLKTAQIGHVPEALCRGPLLN